MEFIGVNEFNLNINDIIVNSSVDISSSLIPVEESPTNLGDTEQAQLVSENVLPLADEDDADDDSSNYEPTYSEEERMEDEQMDEMGEDASEDNILIGDAQIATNDGNVINHIREVPGKRKCSKRGKAKRELWTQIKNKIKRLKRVKNTAEEGKMFLMFRNQNEL